MWWKSLSTHVWIFAVGRGNAAFVRTGLNQGFLLDLGTGKDFSPTKFVEKYLVPKLNTYEKKKIAQAVLSHPHADHIAECGRLSEKPLYPALLTSPHDKPPPDGYEDERIDWTRIDNPSGSEEVIDSYKALYKDRTLPLQTILYDRRRTVPHLEYGIYYVRPPKAAVLHPNDDNEYGNATSVVTYLRHGQNSILVPGDMTPQAMKLVLDEQSGFEKRYTVMDRQSASDHPDWHARTSDQPGLRWNLGEHGLTVLVAPHHGLESCFSEDLYESMRGGKPGIVVISERRHKHPNDGTVVRLRMAPLACL